MVTRLLRGVKLDIRKIHIRYEDDFYQVGRPFSAGFTIERIGFDNHEEEEQRQRAEENSSTILKLLEVKNVSLYWNSMSEMFIPTSVWQQSLGLEFGVFELIEADMIH